MSSAFRVTQRSITTTTMKGLQANQTRMQQIQEQLSSGRQVNRPSDSPVKTVEAMQFRGTLSRTEQYIRNADDGLALLTSADSALSGSLELTRRVRELTLRLRGHATIAGHGHSPRLLASSPSAFAISPGSVLCCSASMSASKRRNARSTAS